MSNQTLPSYYNTEFEIGDLVWGKITGYPWWPATIANFPEQQQPVFKILFLGDQSYGNVPESKIMPYKKYRDKYFKQKQSKEFKKAVALADQLMKTDENTQANNEDWENIEENVMVNVEGVKSQVLAVHLNEERQGNQNSEKIVKREQQESRNKENCGAVEYEQIEQQELVESIKIKQVKLLIESYYLADNPENKASKTRSSQSLFHLNLTKKINMLLKQKGISNANSRIIAVYLANQMTQQNTKIEGIYGKFFGWLNRSTCQEIEATYQKWNSCSKQSSQSKMRTQDNHE